jgi:type 1 glutamine amidotransferase
MNRREMLARTGAAALTLGLGRSSFPLGWSVAADTKKDTPKRRLLMYTRSVGYEHDVVKRPNRLNEKMLKAFGLPKDGKLSLAETIVTDLGKKHGFEVEATKDGRVFVNDDLSKFDAFIFETQGDLMKEGGDGEPPMTSECKQALLKAIENGKGFVGFHCASDTFHSPGRSDQNQSPDKIDPYIAMVGGEFIVHGEQQKARMHVFDKSFPGAKNLSDFELMEEWYALKNFAPNLHVILVQETKGMRNPMYQRPNFPATWARMHQKGRVFFSSMGHRDDVWKNPIFQDLLLGAVSWATGNVDADVMPNLEKAAPQAGELPSSAKK